MRGIDLNGGTNFQGIFFTFIFLDILMIKWDL